MNKIISNWNRWQERKRPGVPDAIRFDDETVVLEDLDMSYDTSLDKGQLRSLITAIKSMHSEKANSLRRVSFETLKRLKVKRDKTKTVAATPSNVNQQFNEGSIVAWFNNVDPDDKKAVAQVVAIDATLVARTEV